MGDPVTASTDEAVAVVHSDPTKDHLSSEADQAVVDAAAARDEEVRAAHFNYEAAAAEVASSVQPEATTTFGSPDGQEEPTS